MRHQDDGPAKVGQGQFADGARGAAADAGQALAAGMRRRWGAVCHSLNWSG